MTLKEKIKMLQKRFPDIHGIKDGEIWGAGENSIHLGDIAEGGNIDGMMGAYKNAYIHDPEEKTFIMGVHKKMVDALNEIGYYAEWYDGGTIIAYPK